MLKLKDCRACSGKLITFLDLGKQYISDFRLDDSKPPKYPIVVAICDDCKLVQLLHNTPQAEMYHNNYGFKSGVSESIKKDLDDIVTHAFQYVNDPETWLDVGSNDGSLLSFVPTDIFRVGVDPVELLCIEAEQHADLIINDYFGRFTAAQDINCDVITTVSCFYDMPNPSQFVEDIIAVLADKGVWVIQQNYLLSTLQIGAVDNFCHEHLEYYTLMSLENLLDRFGLEVNEVRVSPMNGGSIRTIVSHKGTFEIDDSVAKQRGIEINYGLDTMEPYEEFALSIEDNLNQLRRLVFDLKNYDNKTIFILAASTRGSTIWQAADIGPDMIDFAVERNPAKVGKYFSAIGIPIISEEQAHALKPDYMIVGPWFFEKEITEREKDYLNLGGHLIYPLPEVKIVGA